MKYKAVIFDLFGTIAENRFPKEYNRVLLDMASILSVPSQDFTSLWTKTYPKRATGFFPTIESNIKYICKVLNFQVKDKWINDALKVRFDFTRRSLKPQKEAVRILIDLKTMGCKTGLISNCAPDVPLFWEKTPFNSLIDVPIFSCKVGFKKPDQRIYSLAYKRLAMKPGECLYVGDGGSYELEAASKAGMHPILIRASDFYKTDPYLQEAREWQGVIIVTLRGVLELVK